jgi:phosphoglycerate dehydrogenase-like enzyme
MDRQKKSSRVRIVVLDDIHRQWPQTNGIAKLKHLAGVKIFTDPARSRPELIRRLRGVQIIIANRERTQFAADLFAALPDLELICNTGAHAAHIDMAAARSAGIKVFLAPGAPPRVSGRSTAELTIALIQAVMRRIPQSDRAIRRGEWPLVIGEVLYGKTLGILGLGRVGSQVARLAFAYGMNVIAWSPRLTQSRARRCSAAYRELEALLRESDVISVHLSLNDDTRGLIDARRLSLLKPTAYLVNTARGAIVDETALIRSLKQSRFAGAALDVFESEPLLSDHPLTKLNNVVLTPHLGWPADLTYEAFANDCAAKITRYLSNRRC